MDDTRKILGKWLRYVFPSFFPRLLASLPLVWDYGDKGNFVVQHFLGYFNLKPTNAHLHFLVYIYILNFYLFIYFWLCWVFVSVRGPPLVAASRGHSSSRCAGLSLSRPLLLRSTSSRRAGSVVVAHGPSCSAACGNFPDQGSNPCALHWQADSQPLRHQGSPSILFLMLNQTYFLKNKYSSNIY